MVAEAVVSTRAITVGVAAVLVAGLAACGSGAARDGSASSSPQRPATSSTPTTPPTTTPPTTPVAPQTPTSTPRPTPRVSPTPSSTRSRNVVVPAPNACATTARYLGRDLEVVPTTAKVAVLTFDGGASSDGVTSILATLAAKHAAATFFLTGDFVRDHPGATAAIAAAHPVGNHTDTHPDLTTLSSSRVVDEVRDGAAAIRAATGAPPHPWFRFPYGARDARTIALVNDECYVAVRWTVDSLGWKGTSGGMTTAKVRDRVLAAARPGMVVLMHVGANPDDGTTLDAAALPAVIDGLRARGYSFLTLQQAL
jgi:peptidoglycan/xylan/chitin deacetylase (PgdA/CDA1 family)